MSYSLAVNLASPSTFFNTSQAGAVVPIAKREQTKNYFNSGQIASNSQVLYFSELGQSLVMKEVLQVPYVKESGYYLITKSIEGYTIALAEKSIKDLLESFKEELQEAWQYYALEEDENLTNNAKRVKQWLLDNIEEV